MTAGEYDDGTLGEVFIKMSKQGSTLAGVMDAFSVSISIGLQYGVPLEAFVSKYINMRFDPAGMTDDADIRIAQSVMDYLFRRWRWTTCRSRRARAGIFSAEERAAAVAGGSYGGLTTRVGRRRRGAGAVGAGGVGAGSAWRAAPAAAVGSSTELLEAMQGTAADAPLCMTCGTKMRPAGSCYVCEGCGSTSGCS
jgi:ribonucleoside-diphosphate reductase alpha chain